MLDLISEDFCDPCLEYFPLVGLKTQFAELQQHTGWGKSIQRGTGPGPDALPLSLCGEMVSDVTSKGEKLSNHED